MDEAILPWRIYSAFARYESVIVTRCGGKLLMGARTLEKNVEVPSLNGMASEEERCDPLLTNHAWRGYKIDLEKTSPDYGALPQ